MVSGLGSVCHESGFQQPTVGLTEFPHLLTDSHSANSASDGLQHATNMSAYMNTQERHLQKNKPGVSLFDFPTW